MTNRVDLILYQCRFQPLEKYDFNWKSEKRAKTRRKKRDRRIVKKFPIFPFFFQKQKKKRKEKKREYHREKVYP